MPSNWFQDHWSRTTGISGFVHMYKSLDRRCDRWLAMGLYSSIDDITHGFFEAVSVRETR
ncbi:hypothetical protein SCLCIDRAFT_1208340 [Scleroderma citrinum Foug A]|uniref:Uncharacterized protein n=1 Tax=Scleroderma citrinum Foug A TaxID=1036808 RepID=A0A0C3EAP7_9AGAM|nr:hypothetical protein SCLCIDRAFT_1208340 [Scleroderma citrinum Foug A]